MNTLSLDPRLSMPEPGALQNDRSREAGEKFESYMLEMMMREMRKTVPEGMFSSSAMEMFGGLLDGEIASRMAQRGMGLSEQIQAQLTRAAPLPADASAIQAHAAAQIRAAFARSERSESGWQLPIEGRLTSRFGHRSDPINGERRMHSGLDLAAPQGTPIHPIRSGEVVRAGNSGGKGGNVVVIDHGGGMRSTYAHCSTINVKPGQRVGPDDVIAAVGSTGRSTGPHLHLEIHRDGRAIDPAEILQLPRTQK